MKPTVVVGIQKFCKSDQCLNIVFKVRIKAAGSTACCAATQTGKMLSAQEIFIACSDSNYRAAMPNCAVPVAGASNPGEEEKGRCDWGITTKGDEEEGSLGEANPKEPKEDINTS